VQHFSPFCTGGHLTLPYEQKTQQSLSLGFNIDLQFEHSKKNWQEFSLIISSFEKPQAGQVIVDNKIIVKNI